jgi:spermidine synthase
MKTDGLTGMYYDYAMAAPLMSGCLDRERTDLLILGMGTGTYATQCGKYFTGFSMEGVEIDDRITALAGKYFDLSEEIPVTTYDGRAYLQAAQGTYDVIMVDAYQDITIPFQMSSTEFFTLVRDHLNEGGVMVVNMNMRSEAPGNINEYLSDTIAGIFPYVYTVDVPGNTNRELFAATDPQAITRLRESAERIEQEDLRQLMQAVGQSLVQYEGGDRILTDDKAPVELLGMSAIDGLFTGEVGYYRDCSNRRGSLGSWTSSPETKPRHVKARAAVFLCCFYSWGGAFSSGSGLCSATASNLPSRSLSTRAVSSSPSPVVSVRTVSIWPSPSVSMHTVSALPSPVVS